MAGRPVPASAGDPGDWDADQQRAERAARSWRRQGIDALPRVWAALQSSDPSLQVEARDVLRGWGAPVVRPLLLRGARAHDAGEPLEIVAEILCHVGRPTHDDDDGGAPPDPARADLRAARAVMVADRPLLSALAGTDRALAGAGLEVLASVTSLSPCPNRALLAHRAAPATLALILAKSDSELPPENVALLASLGTDATPALTRARRWLDDARLRAPATELLAAMGPPALPVLPDLAARLDAMARQGCTPDRMLAAVTARAVGIIGRVAVAGAPAAAAASSTLQRTWRACPAIQDQVIDAIGMMGPRAASAAPALLAIVRDRERPPALRARAATTLDALSVPIDASDQAIEHALLRKEAIREARRGGLPIGPQVQTSDLSLAGAGSPRERDAARVSRAASAVTEEAAICRAEVALDPPGDAFARALAKNADAVPLETLAECLRQHLCGPEPTDRDLTVDACCRRAFGASPPAWCRPTQEQAADY